LIIAVSSTLSTQLLIGNFQVYASESYPYDSGYDHGCDDAGISDPGDRYYNQPEKGPSFHTDAFNRGYNDGFNACSSGGRDDDGGFQQPSQPSTPQGEGIDWFAACGLAHTFLGLQTPCNELVNSDNTLTEQGNMVLLCYGGGLLLLLEGGGLGALSADQLARAAGCPK
jgi:hypothetical protein